mgnify:CR=1 FL=1|jgi:hypothetical protein
MLKDLAARRGLLARSQGNVKSVSDFMKMRWGSLEGFVRAHAADGLRLGADGLIRCQQPVPKGVAPPPSSAGAAPPSRAAVAEMPLVLSQLLSL